LGLAVLGGFLTEAMGGDKEPGLMKSLNNQRTGPIGRYGRTNPPGTDFEAHSGRQKEAIDYHQNTLVVPGRELMWGSAPQITPKKVEEKKKKGRDFGKRLSEVAVVIRKLN